jgi:beta-lactamase class A
MLVTLNRRSFLGVAGALVAGGCARGKTPCANAPLANSDSLVEIEQRIGGRVGVFAMKSGTGRHLERRADERFAMCSTFKWALAAAVLARVDRGELRLDQPVTFGEPDLLEYAPVTRAHLEIGQMTIQELAQASVTISDNTAANLLLAKVGGPPGLTRFFRELGDQVTRLDRDEPMLNTNLAGDARDTTSPRAMARSLEKVLAGNVLSAASRDILVGWLVATETGRARLRAGLPAGWRAGDKTGTGNNGACNDVAIVWPPSGAPWFVASYLSESSAALERLNAAHADIGRTVARAQSTQTRQ